MPTPRTVVRSDMSRVWAMEDGAGPAVEPEYMGVWKAGPPSWDFGEAAKIEIPSDVNYMQYQEVGSIPGETGKPTMSFEAYYTEAISDMLRMARRECYHDFQVHIGKCGSVQDFNGGWSKILVLEHARISNWSADDIGDLTSGDRAAVNESIDVQGTNLYEILKLAVAEVCSVNVVQEVLGVVFCDTKACGECGEVSNGCQKFFAIIRAVGGSPGLGAQVVYSDDQGSTCGATPITTLAANEDPDDVACHGEYLIVVSEDSISHHYADKEDILDGVEVWAEVAAGYNAGGAPRCIFTLKPGYTWIGGAGGYVYFLTGATEQPTIQDAGAATTEDLNDAHAYDEENVLMVGANNAVIHTTDGETWAAITGPEPGVDLLACWMKSETEWWIGSNTGHLYYTLDSGVNWIEKVFTGGGVGVVYDILFVTKQVGYLAHTTATSVGRILRTIDGGYSWYVLPETGTFPDNDRIVALAGCGEPNLVIGGGLGPAAADGILVKAS